MGTGVRNGSLPTSSEPSARPVGRLTATRDAPVGGQAVLEGVMMRGVRTWAVAVRKPGAVEGELGEIDVQSFPLVSWARKHRVYRWPVIRGVVALAESLGIGLRALGISANAQLPEEEQQISGGAWAGTVIVALVFAVGLFFVVPVGLTSLIKHQLGSSLLFWAVEGVLRTSIFLGYLVLLSRVPDLRRVFEYHGAEHKVISCYEAEDELVPERATLYSRLHPRCGTSFLLVVMIMAIFVFAPVGLPVWWLLVLTRILGVPLIAGLSFEVIKWAGKNRRRRWVQVIMYPGLQLQRLTTREPDLDQLAVAIASLQAVLAVETPGEASAEDMLGVEVVA
ncbi:MAG: hypothetical protein QOD66_4249 [Solirubrobacteraceae bacterium]|jgi:uncharacterized protein YqhQ|nr:hypothetical protein [Solirubrobacteraceae bacterium]